MTDKLLKPMTDRLYFSITLTLWIYENK